MPIGIMGRQKFGVNELRLMVFTNKEREGIKTFVWDVSLYVAQTTQASIKDH